MADIRPLSEPFEINYDRPISESDINGIIRQNLTLPDEDKQVLIGLRSELTHEKYQHALSDLTLTIHLDISQNDYILKSGNGNNKIVAQRDIHNEVEIMLFNKTCTCRLEEFGDRLLAKLEELFMKLLDLLIAKVPDAIKHLAQKATAQNST